MPVPTGQEPILAGFTPLAGTDTGDTPASSNPRPSRATKGQTMTDNDEPLLSVKQVVDEFGERYGVTKDWLYDQTQARKIAHIRRPPLGENRETIFFRRSVIERVLFGEEIPAVEEEGT